MFRGVAKDCLLAERGGEVAFIFGFSFTLFSMDYIISIVQCCERERRRRKKESVRRVSVDLPSILVAALNKFFIFD